MITLIVTVTVLLAAIAGLIAIFHARNTTTKVDIMEGVRERAEQRRLDRAFMNTTPAEDPYERPYDLTSAMSAVEVDESANGYGDLSEEQKRVIAAIFDGQSQTPTTLASTKQGVVAGSRWSRSVFGELNQVDPIPEKDIWSTSRN